MRKLRWWERSVKKLTGQLDRAGERLVHDWIVGVIVSGSTILSAVARALHPSKKAFEAALERLSRGLSKQGRAVALATGAYRRRAVHALRTVRRGVAAIDLSEIVKPYGRKMQYLCKVRDGSQSRKKKPVIENGWWTVEVGLSFPEHQFIPLWRHAFSTEHPDFESEQHELRKALEQISLVLPPGTRGVFDIGFDGMSYFQVIEDYFAEWAVRQRGDRDIVLAGQDRPERMSLVADAVHKDHEAKPWVVRDGNLERLSLQFGYVTVELPGGSSFRRKPVTNANPMTLIVVERPHRKDPAQPPMMLLVNHRVRDAAEARQWVEAYFRRWGSEEQTRAGKQLGGLEDLRVLRWDSITNLVALSVVVEGLLALIPFEAPRRAHRLARLAPIDGEVPPFVLYRLWMTVALLLQGRQVGR